MDNDKQDVFKMQRLGTGFTKYQYNRTIWWQNIYLANK